MTEPHQLETPPFDIGLDYIIEFPRACPGFLKGGGPISLGSLKKRSSDFKRGGSNGLMGGVQYINLPRTTNLAYLDAKE